jgi:imidazolonepropionase-like amidohydrolase
LRSALSRGFTTVRDVAGGDIGVANAIARGYLIAPRYLYTGAALSQTGGHGDPRPADFDMCAHGHHMGEVVDGVDALRRAVRERFRTGAHCIKVMASGGVVSLTDPIRMPQYSAEELRAVVDEASRRNSYVAAHAYSPEAIVHAVTNGIRTIEHGNLLDEEAAGVMAEHGAYLVPTLVAYDAMHRRGDQTNMSAISKAKNQEVLTSGLKAIEIARSAGVTIGWGSDLMGELEDDQLSGLQLQMEVESPFEVLRSATSVNAEILQRPDLGRIELGATGDLLILDGNPFDEPAVLWDQHRPRTVVHGGTVVH